MDLDTENTDETLQPSISYPSLLVSFAFFLQLTNYTLLRDGLPMWKLAFIQNNDMMVNIQIIILLGSVISMAIGALIYNFCSRKVYALGIFSIGVIVGNVFIRQTCSYYMTPLDDTVQNKMILGYSLAFGCMGASLPFLLDYCFSKIPDNDNFEKSVSLLAGFMFLFWMVAQLFSFRVLQGYQKYADATSCVPLIPLILSILAFILVFIAGIVAVLQEPDEVEGPPPNLVEDMKSKNPHAIRDYYIAVACALFSGWIFYFLKDQLVPLWLSFVEYKMYRQVGSFVYTPESTYDQYLFFTVIAWFIVKLILNRNNQMGPFIATIAAIAVAIYVLYFSRDIFTLFEIPIRKANISQIT